MDPGEFDTLISIVRDVETGRDAAGAPTVSRQTLARPWAKMVHQSGREFLAGDGEATERRVVFRLYAVAGVDTDAIVVAKGQDHEVTDVQTTDGVMVLATVAKAAGR